MENQVHAVSLPVAVKLTPYFTNVAYMARRLDLAGANALVLFNNRFYQGSRSSTAISGPIWLRPGAFERTEYIRAITADGSMG